MPEPAPGSMTVDVVVVTRDTRELTGRCVESILAADASDVRISCTVVDNASTDGTAEEIEARWPQVRVIRNSENVGYGAACNQGLRGGSAEYVLILNSDIIARPAAIARLVGYLASSPTHVATGGRLVDPGTDRPQIGHNVRGFPTLWSQLGLLLGLERWWPRNPMSRRMQALDLDYERTQDVDQPAGACLACRRVDFDAIGGFDEGFYYWYEDVDLVRRMSDRGGIAYVHDAAFEHVKGATFDQWSLAEGITSWYLGVLRYFAKHRPRWEQIAIRVVVGISAVVRLLFWAPPDRKRARACVEVVGIALRGRGSV